jgi:cytochrome c556
MKLTLLAAAFTVTAASAAAAAEDSRQLVNMPAPMVQHMLSNMRDHLLALTEIQQSLGKGEYQRAADIAEKRIGLSSLESHGASHMAPFMPKAMQDIGTQMHKAASQFAIVAQESSADGNALRSVGALSEVTKQCVACHASYRAH